MSDRAELLQNFIVAARLLAAEGMSGLNPEKALLVNAAQERGADVILMYVTSTETVIGALHFPDPAADPVELFRIVVPSSEVSH
jgi:hypothetical protein